MAQPIELVPLVCLKCNSRLPARLDESAWVCEQCGQAQSLDEILGLERQDIHYAADIPPGSKGKPYWVVEGKAMLKRETYDRGDKEAQQARLFWEQPHRFYIPAYACSFSELLDKGVRLVIQPPDPHPGGAAPFEAVTLPYRQIRPLAEFIVMAIEAGRKDQLKQLDFLLELSMPALWVLRD